MRRDIHDVLCRLLSDEGDARVLIVEGARQVGKSYLVQDVLQNSPKEVLSFDLEKDKKFTYRLSCTQSADDFRNLLQDQYGLGEKSVLFIDEAQESRKLSGYVKSFKEDWQGVKVILTGSSMNRFFSKQERIPVGRTKSLCVFGFNFTEFIKFVKGDELAAFIHSSPKFVEPSRHSFLLDLFDEYMYTGGYPEAVKAYTVGNDYVEVIEEILATLEEDFARKESADPELFLDTLQGVANNIGSPSKYTHFKTSKYNAKRIVEAMKAWHLILEVKPQSLNPLHSNFLPKRYLHDLGVINIMRGQPVPTLSILDSLNPALRTPLGGLFENAALINLLNGKSAKKSIYTWKKDSKTSVEIDFVLNLPGIKEKIPLECKATLSLKKRHYANLMQYLRLSDQATGILVSAAPFSEFIFDKNKRIINIPIYLLNEQNIINYLET